MSQIGSRFRKKCLRGKLQVAMGDSVFQSHWRKKKGSVRQAGLFASISCPEGAGVAPAAQAGGAVWVCAGA